MAATIEIKYYNSFWLKKVNSLTNVSSLTADGKLPNTTTPSVGSAIGTNTITVLNSLTTFFQESTGVGQTLSYTISGTLYTYTIIYKVVGGSTTTFTLSKNIQGSAVTTGTVLTFGKILNNAWFPSRYAEDIDKDWFIEESRIRGGYNNTSVDLGVKAYIVEDMPQRQRLISSLIYSGIFNSKTGVNNTNQFSVGEDITRSVDPSQGSIQKLYAEDTNLIIFQELKVSRALIDKDAVYSADGQPMTTSGSAVIGQIQSYAGNYGIGTHPESFAVYGYRKYFADNYQNVICRLSQDGITEISSYGMFDFFRDRLSNTNLSNGFIYGMWDMHAKQYVLSLQPSTVDTTGKTVVDEDNSFTLSFDEESLGWTSFHSYIPNQGISLRNNYYTFKSGAIYRHYAPNAPKAFFYNQPYKSEVTVILNPEVSMSKSFLTVNYEGTNNWGLTSFYTETDASVGVGEYFFPSTLSGIQDQLFENKFKKKENKYFANLLNISAIQSGEVLYGQQISGVKGFFAHATLTCNNATVISTLKDKAELFAVSAEYVESSY